MDWSALYLSLKLGVLTLLVLLPFGIWLGRAIALKRFPGRSLLEGILAFPWAPAHGARLLPAVGLGAARHLAALSRRCSEKRLPSASGPARRIGGGEHPLRCAAHPARFRIDSAGGPRGCGLLGLSPWKTLRRVELPWPGPASPPPSCLCLRIPWASSAWS
jgi:molybdate transport system permease protein